ncbi:MAG: hypothetical protein ACRCSU_11910 [Paracoccaceae bacterium]
MKPFLRIMVAILIAYAVACAVVVLIWQTANGNPFTAEALVSGMFLTAVCSAPGFVVLRLAMWAGRMSNVLGFAGAGAVNGLIALSLFFRAPTIDWFFAAMGVAAGGAYWLVERMIAGEVLARSAHPTGERA